MTNDYLLLATHLPPLYTSWRSSPCSLRSPTPSPNLNPNPNPNQVLERQLVASGLVQAVQASRAGFSDHLPPAHLVAQVTAY